jgi:hypothetical protein
VEGVGHGLLVQDPVQSSVVTTFLGGLGPYGDRPGPGRPVGVDEQVAGNPVQPRPDGEALRAQLRQVPPGPDERFLHDVLGAGPVRTEPFGVPAHGRGMAGVELADRGVGVAGRAAGGVWKASITTNTDSRLEVFKTGAQQEPRILSA